MTKNYFTVQTLIRTLYSSMSICLDLCTQQVVTHSLNLNKQRTTTTTITTSTLCLHLFLVDSTFSRKRKVTLMWGKRPLPYKKCTNRARAIHNPSYTKLYLSHVVFEKRLRSGEKVCSIHKVTSPKCRQCKFTFSFEENIYTLSLIHYVKLILSRVAGKGR